MKKKGNAAKIVHENRTGGVYIDGSRVNVSGDLVGGDKVTIQGDDRQFEDLVARVIAEIKKDGSLGAQERQEAVAKAEELKAELKKPSPDLGKLDQLKQFLSSKGGSIAVAVGALFQYPPVQQGIQAVMKRLIGG